MYHFGIHKTRNDAGLEIPLLERRKVLVVAEVMNFGRSAAKSDFAGKQYSRHLEFYF